MLGGIVHAVHGAEPVLAVVRAEGAAGGIKDAIMIARLVSFRNGKSSRLSRRAQAGHRHKNARRAFTVRAFRTSTDNSGIAKLAESE